MAPQPGDPVMTASDAALEAETSAFDSATATLAASAAPVGYDQMEIAVVAGNSTADLTQIEKVAPGRCHPTVGCCHACSRPKCP